MTSLYESEKEKTEIVQKKLLEYIKNYDRFIMKIVLNVKRKCKRLETDDIKQQIYFVLLKSCNKIDLIRTEKMSTYFSSVVINASNNIVRKYWQDNNKVNIESVSLDAICFEGNEENSQSYISFVRDDSDSFYSPVNYYQRNEFEDKLTKLKNSLSGLERKVFVLYLKGETIENISSKFKKSKKTIYNILSLIKEKIKKCL